MFRTRIQGMWTVVMVLSTVLSVIGAARAQEVAAAKEPAVKVCGLQIVAPAYNDDMEMRAFNWSTGTTLAVLVTRLEGGLIQIDEDKSTLDRLTDDLGTNLLEGENSFGRSGIGGFPSIAKDQTAAIVELSGPGVPATGATKLVAAGTLVLRTSTQKQTFSQKDVAIKKDTQIKAGDIPFVIENVADLDWEEGAVQIDLAAKQAVDRIAEIRFLDAEGKLIEDAKSVGSMTMPGLGDSVNVTLNYTLPKKHETVTIEIDYWMDMQEVSVPFDVTTSVGM